MGKQLQVPGELAPGFTEALGETLDFAQLWSVEGKDAICLPQLGLLYNYGFSLIVSRAGHFYLYLMNFNSSGFLKPLFIKISFSFKRHALLCAIALSKSPASHAFIHRYPLS